MFSETLKDLVGRFSLKDFASEVGHDKEVKKKVSDLCQLGHNAYVNGYMDAGASLKEANEDFEKSMAKSWVIKEIMGGLEGKKISINIGDAKVTFGPRGGDVSGISEEGKEKKVEEESCSGCGKSKEECKADIQGNAYKKVWDTYDLVKLCSYVHAFAIGLDVHDLGDREADKKCLDAFRRSGSHRALNDVIGERWAEEGLS